MKQFLTPYRWLPLGLSLLLINCGTPHKTGYIKFQPTENEIIANSLLKDFLASNKMPKIVLRVPRSSSDVTEKSVYDVYYNAIEKEFLKAGFIVRDRALFNEILAKNQSSDYSQIKELTDTDLILEVVNINPKVVYSTNKYFTKKKYKERLLPSGEIRKAGASAEFKIVMVKTNQLAGDFKFNYTPCDEGKGCLETINLVTGASYTPMERGRTSKQAYESIQSDLLEKFIILSTQHLIKNFKS